MRQAIKMCCFPIYFVIVFWCCIGNVMPSFLSEHIIYRQVQIKKPSTLKLKFHKQPAFSIFFVNLHNRLKKLSTEAVTLLL